MSSEVQTTLGDGPTTDNGQKPRKRDRFKGLFKRKDQPQQAPSPQTSGDVTKQHAMPSDANTGERQRTRARYLDAAKLLGETIKMYEGQWGSFDFPELNGEPEDFDDSLFREKINAVIDARESAVMDGKAWARCKHAAQCAFAAFSPFAKHFLLIAKEGQAVFAIPNTSNHSIDAGIEPIWVALRWPSFIDYCNITYLIL